MSVYPFQYKVLNRATGRKVSVTRWRVQIRKSGERINKVFEDEGVARTWEKQELDRISMGVAPELILDIQYQMHMPDLRKLLSDYFSEHMSKQAKSSFKTNQNRCLRAIPRVPIHFKHIGKKIDNYRYRRECLNFCV